MAVLIPVTGAMTPMKPPRSNKTAKWGYRDLQQVVGGVFEILYPRHSKDCTQVLVAHEEGAILNLPVNVEATSLWQTWGGRDSLRGPVLLVKLAEIE